MTDECIQVMGGMGFMKVQEASLLGGAAGREEQAAASLRGPKICPPPW